ncbi:pilus assembly protein [Pectobacterium odoriferum]|uniref:type II secretion system F family protein n=1 Tax=Pectobacterium TaxID=122277 RepID=UPI000CD21A15|nr:MULTISPECIES: type II secretion system F family protein [Pectobacterium]POE07531.1 pilus assembly protein [Pectobacterium odoriferum]TKY82153.1 pilus assembly protein [Pectobacterium polonicum]
MVTLLIVIFCVLLVLGVFLILSVTWPPMMRRTFWLTERIKFWQMVRTFWRMEMLPAEIFDIMRDIYSDNGKRRNRGSLLCQQLSDAVSKRTFGEMNLPGPCDQIATPEDVLAAWCSPLEAVLFRVGNVSGNMSEALAQSISLLKYIQQIRSAMVPALGQMGLVLCSVPGILYGVSQHLLPAMSKLIPEERWTLHIIILNSVSHGIQEHGAVLCFVIGMITFRIIRTIPKRGGVIRRRFLEFIPPWSIYSTLQGALFMLSAGSLLKAGMLPLDVLNTLSKHASPWLVARLDAAAFRVRSGRNLGLALYESGYNFPSRESAIFLSRAGASRDIADVLNDWGQEQMPVALERIRSLSNWLTFGLGGVIGAFLIYVMFAVVGLTMTLSSQGF